MWRFTGNNNNVDTSRFSGLGLCLIIFTMDRCGVSGLDNMRSTACHHPQFRVYGWYLGMVTMTASGSVISQVCWRIPHLLRLFSLFTGGPAMFEHPKEVVPCYILQPELQKEKCAAQRNGPTWGAHHWDVRSDWDHLQSEFAHPSVRDPSFTTFVSTYMILYTFFCSLYGFNDDKTWINPEVSTLWLGDTAIVIGRVSYVGYTPMILPIYPGWLVNMREIYYPIFFGGYDHLSTTYYNILTLIEVSEIPHIPLKITFFGWLLSYTHTIVKRLQPTRSNQVQRAHSILMEEGFTAVSNAQTREAGGTICRIMK